jgi:hypothetical protein
MESNIEEGDERLEILQILEDMAKRHPDDARLNRDFVFSLQDQLCRCGRISKHQYLSVLKIYEIISC